MGGGSDREMWMGGRVCTIATDINKIHASGKLVLRWFGYGYGFALFREAKSGALFGSSPREATL